MHHSPNPSPKFRRGEVPICHLGRLGRGEVVYFFLSTKPIINMAVEHFYGSTVIIYAMFIADYTNL
jgi:hypothetical protein